VITPSGFQFVSGQVRTGTRNRVPLRFPVPVSALLAVLCIGCSAAAQGVCAGAVFDLILDPPHHGYVPFIGLELAGRRGFFMIDTGATLSSANSDIFGEARDEDETLRGFSFPDTAEAAFFRRRFAPGPFGAELLGIVGSDILMDHRIELHYDAPTPFLVVGARSCAPEPRAAAFVPIDQRGYYSAIPEHAAPDIAHVPTVFLRIGDVAAPAQLDSGFADALAPGSGNDGLPAGGVGEAQVNDAFLDRLQAMGVATAPAGTIRQTNCRLARFEVETLRVTGLPLEITAGIGGPPLFAYRAPVLQRKKNTECGGIGDYAAAFGLIGASYLKNWGTVVIDPWAEQLWIRRPPPPGVKPGGW
jgi:hypothetical protein